LALPPSIDELLLSPAALIAASFFERCSC